MVTNGSNFVFIKLVNQTENLQYAKSNRLLIEKSNDRIQILQILNQIGQNCRDGSKIITWFPIVDFGTDRNST